MELISTTLRKVKARSGRSGCRDPLNIFSLSRSVQNQKGFSLIEMVLVLLIFGLIVLMIVNLPSSIQLIGVSKNSSLAKEIASAKIENLRSSGFENLVTGQTTLVDSRLSKLPSSSGTVIIEDCPVSICTQAEIDGNIKIKVAKVKVSWRENNANKDLTIDTLISEGGLK
ncbi:type II secretion system protein [Candidatus Daviesbacteria bacterium]|nr:type II secretion system protein [Candidatus Daviesbacteria bacterium]